MWLYLRTLVRTWWCVDPLQSKINLELTYTAPADAGGGGGGGGEEGDEDEAGEEGDVMGEEGVCMYVCVLGGGGG